jgi:hypothetical protein
MTVARNSMFTDGSRMSMSGRTENGRTGDPERVAVGRVALREYIRGPVALGGG